MSRGQNPQAPRSYLENVANHLAWRRTVRATNGVLLAVLALVGIGVPLAIRDPAAVVAPVVAVVLGVIVIVTDLLHRRSLARRPVARESAPPSARGMASDASAWVSIGIVGAIVLGLTVILGASGAPNPWMMIQLGTPVWLAVVALAVPGLVVRRRRWALLAQALRDPAVLAELQAVRDHYPPYAALPFAAATDGVRMP